MREDGMKERSKNLPARFAALSVGVAIALTALGANGSEVYDYDPSVPNGSLNSCLTCHTTIEGIDLNSFGWDVQNHKGGDGVTPDWAAVCGLDSDVDGQTNGQELGDPCCEWQMGQAFPRSDAISNPGDSSDQSANPDAPGCSADDDDGGCSTARGPVDAPAGAAALAVLVGLLLTLRRRR
ncbi:MAG: hypothetical protein JRI23_21615 [Deltaproteobacteria bacterium]|jgi:hypothetical protein|nr:hypothetical protein [Deltaproteobacteria bacterium]MBW2534541.1 hypothetical protein [Deltaproteobacteria bacterium]